MLNLMHYRDRAVYRRPSRAARTPPASRPTSAPETVLAIWAPQSSSSATWSNWLDDDPGARWDRVASCATRRPVLHSEMQDRPTSSRATCTKGRRHACTVIRCTAVAGTLGAGRRDNWSSCSG